MRVQDPSIKKLRAGSHLKYLKFLAIPMFFYFFFKFIFDKIDSIQATLGWNFIWDKDPISYVYQKNFSSLSQAMGIIWSIYCPKMAQKWPFFEIFAKNDSIQSTLGWKFFWDSVSNKLEFQKKLFRIFNPKMALMDGTKNIWQSVYQFTVT